MPVLLNCLGLLFVVFFIFGYLGMIVFGSVRYGSYINEHASFRDMGQALLILFRVSTQDGW